MDEREHGPAESQGDGQPENIRDLQDASGGSAMSRPPREAASDDTLPESGMGGTSDAGAAADDAAGEAAHRRGLPEDAAKRRGGANEPGP